MQIKINVELIIDGDNADILAAVDAALDDGVLQDWIAEWSDDHNAGLLIKSALTTTMEPVTDPQYE